MAEFARGKWLVGHNILGWDLPRPSAWTNFPTAQDPFGKYKHGSLWLEFKPDQSVIERKTYMLLEWLGDVGGLFGALYQIGAVLLFPFRSFALKTELLTSIFRFVEARPAEKNDMQSKDFIDKQMLWDFQNIHKIARQGFFQTIFGLGKNAKYKRQLSKAESAIKTELDLQKFIKR